MQRWGSEQVPSAALLLRTGALASLASLGTAVLVFSSAVGVGGDASDGAGSFGALGNGPSSVVDATSTPTPTRSQARTAVRPVTQTAVAVTAPRTELPAAATPVAPPSAGEALAGTTSWAAQAPLDVDSLARHARELPAPAAPLDAAHGPARPVDAVRNGSTTPAAAPHGTARPVDVAPVLGAPDTSGRPAPAAGAPVPPPALPQRALEGLPSQEPAPRQAVKPVHPGRPQQATKPQQGKAQPAARPAPAAKPQQAATPQQLAKPAHAAEPQQPAKPQQAATPQLAPKPQQPAKPQQASKPQPAAEAQQPVASSPPAEQTTSPDAGGHGPGGDRPEHPKGEPPGQAKGNGRKH